MKSKLIMSVILMALLSACAGTPSISDNAALEDAVNAVSAASQDPTVEQYAPVELQQAKDTLGKAEMVWRKTGDQTRTNHLAYLAERHAQIAQAMGAEGEAQAEAKKAEQARHDLVLQSRNQELSQRKSEIQELREKLAKLKPRQTDRGIVLTIGNVLFAFDSADLSAAAQDPLDKLASFLRAHPEDRVRVEGYTDSVGSAAYNQRLSEQRAQSVADAMIRRGIDPARMTVVGYGESNPVAPNTTDYGRQQNRRVNFVIQNVEQAQGTSPSQGGGAATSVGAPSPSNQMVPTVTLPADGDM